MKYPDCNSPDIEFIDSCLLDKPLSYAIDKLNTDSSKFFLFDEPPGVLRGIYIFKPDSIEIRLYTERLAIIDSLGFINYDTSKYILNNKKIMGVSWRKKESKTERIIGERIWYWGF